MPSKPLRYCLTPGCAQKTSQARCEAHQASNRAVVRQGEDLRYRTQQWTDYSKQFRAEHPMCAIQASYCTLITDVVDHILPVRTHPHLFWEVGNHRPACQSCNQWAARQSRTRGVSIAAGPHGGEG